LVKEEPFRYYEGVRIDPLIDGHPEKPLPKMTPREKIHYLWLQMEFKHAIRNRKNLGKIKT